MKKENIFFNSILILIILGIIAFFIAPKNMTANAVKEPYSRLDVYFCPVDMCKDELLSLIDASTDIKCAFYELNLPDLISALKKKNAEVIIEDSTFEKATESFHTGFSQALMHNKFCIFDNHIISTGSMNPTFNDNFLNNNNLLIIDSKTLAKNYLDEFNELKNDVYGKGNNVKNPVVYLGDTEIENYFCPDDKCKLHVINALKKANSSIYFMTFSFTDVDIGNLLWNKHYEGLDVKGIFDQNQLSDYSRYEELKEFSIIDKNKYKLHDKVFIIDNETVITGSYNPSRNADEFNDENILIIHDRKIAEKYVLEFLKLYGNGQNAQKEKSGIVISKVVYDPDGADTGKEIVELKNIGSENINLEYYFISDNKTNMKLDGTVDAGKTVFFTPKFALKNSNGLLYLKHNSDVIDFVAWEGMWNLEAKEGHALERIDFEDVSEDGWVVK